MRHDTGSLRTASAGNKTGISVSQSGVDTGNQCGIYYVPRKNLHRTAQRSHTVVFLSYVISWKMDRKESERRSCEAACVHEEVAIAAYKSVLYFDLIVSDGDFR